MRKRSMTWGAAPAVLLCVVAVAPAAAQLAPIPQDRGSNGLGLALRRIGVTPRVLYVTAHPDDEHNGMLVRLSRGLGVRTALLTLTRGDGGQNEIGPELFEALGVLRSEELAAIHRYDGAEQYFGHSYEFGYSFSVEETFQKWGREAALGDVVRIVRAFRPDVILTLPVQGPGGGQHHQAAGQLAREAFRAAADASRFADMGPAPWQARKVYQGGVGNGAGDGGARPLTVRTGVYDPLLGLTWQQLGSVERGLHRSQGSNALMSDPGEGEASFLLLDSEPKVAAFEGDVLDGLDLTLAGLLRFAPDHATAAPFLRSDLQALQARVDSARAAFDPGAPEKTLPSLQAVLAGARALGDKVRGSALDGRSREELIDRLGDEARDVERALGLAHGLEIEALTDDDVVVPGQSFTVTTRIANLGAAAVPLEDIALVASEGWPVRNLEGSLRELARGETAIFRHQVTVPAATPPSQPYWRRSRSVDRYEISDKHLAGRPWSPPNVTAVVRYRSGEAAISASQPAQWRYQSPWGGEKQKVAAVGSEISVLIQPEVTVAAIGSGVPREFHVTVRNQRRGLATGRVRLEAPRGWSVEPREAPMSFRHEGEEMATRFLVTPASALAAGEAEVRAVFVDEAGREFSAGDQVIAYEHVHERRLVRPAIARVVAVEVAVTPGIAVGYVDGAGDEVDTAIAQLGIPLTYLATDDLAFGDLSRFSTIVTGIRAYQTRADLRSYHRRLLAYVEAGGNLVVQYNKFDFNQVSEPPRAGGFSGTRPAQSDSPYAPYPASVSSARVTDENSAPRIVSPQSPLLTRPNPIGEADWQGWVQERGLYFLDARDARYEEVVAFTDPFSLNPGEKRGALLDAAVGRGRWTYLGLGLFRQLPAGVPGAYRLLANIVGRPRAR